MPNRQEDRTLNLLFQPPRLDDEIIQQFFNQLLIEKTRQQSLPFEAAGIRTAMRQSLDKETFDLLGQLLQRIRGRGIGLAERADILRDKEF